MCKNISFLVKPRRGFSYQRFFRQQFKETITKAFDEFKQTYLEMRMRYLTSLFGLVNSIQDKIYGLRMASMTQRSMLMVLFQDYCETKFYHDFTQCSSSEVPLLGEDMYSLLGKLNDFQWDTITSIGNIESRRLEANC